MNIENRTMRRKIMSGLLFCFLFVQGEAQEQRFKGYPSREGVIDIKDHFVNPPKGYGNVPFYWWNGDSLNYERLMDQLNTLSESSVDGLAVIFILILWWM